MKGITLGQQKKLEELVCKKLKKKCTVSQIADMLEEEESTIQAICDAVKARAITRRT